MPTVIRPATPADVPGIVAVHVAGFRAGNAPHLPPGQRDRMTPERSAAGWRSMLEGATDGVTTLVSEEAGSLVGIAAAGPARDDDQADTSGEVYVLYVDPGTWHRGHGTALDAAAREALAEAGFARAVLWVLEANDRARRFYEHRGWATDGARAPHAGSTAVRYAVALV